jgi:hypothetical protein
MELDLDPLTKKIENEKLEQLRKKLSNSVERKELEMNETSRLLDAKKKAKEEDVEEHENDLAANTDNIQKHIMEISALEEQIRKHNQNYMVKKQVELAPFQVMHIY